MLPPLPPEVFALSLEQQAMLAIFNQSAEYMTSEQLRELLSGIMPQYYVKENVIRHLMKTYG